MEPPPKPIGKEVFVEIRFPGRIASTVETAVLRLEGLQTAKILVRLRRNPQDQSLSYDVMGKIDHAVNFTELADFHFSRSETEMSLSAQVADHSKEVQDLSKMCIVPRRFMAEGRESTPKKYTFDDGQPKKTRDTTLAHWKARDQDSDVPPPRTIPTRRNSEYIAAMQKMFTERPMWHKYAVEERVRQVEPIPPGAENEFFRCLKEVAYNFNDGPFRLIWIRRGYDPRIDPINYRFQSIDFRLPKESFSIPINAYVDLYSCLTNRQHGPETKDYMFRAIPSTHQAMYCLCDIADQRVKTLIDSFTPNAVCTGKYGWLNYAHLRAVRKLMTTICREMKQKRATEVDRGKEGDSNQDGDDSDCDNDNDDAEEDQTGDMDTGEMDVERNLQ